MKATVQVVSPPKTVTYHLENISSNKGERFKELIDNKKDKQGHMEKVG